MGVDRGTDETVGLAPEMGGLGAGLGLGALGLSASGGAFAPPANALESREEAGKSPEAP